MKQGSELKKFTAGLKARSRAVPIFLVQLEPWHRGFFSSLAELLRPTVQFSPSASPAEFWPDVFVTSRSSWRKFSESMMYHTFLIAALWAWSQYWPHRARIVERPVFSKEDVITYSPAEYLPPLNTGGIRAAIAQKADPVRAPQQIISVPPEADNRTQTIVAPPDVKLTHDLPLPNMVAWANAQPSIPLAATVRSTASLKVPAPAEEAVAPPPQLNAASSRNAQAPQPAVIAPPPELQAASTRNVGDLNIGRAEVVAPAPQLPMREQRAVSSTAALGDTSNAIVPPPPSLQGAGTASGGGRLIALGIHPADPSGPVQAPGGNRRGTFAASPAGRVGASGAAGLAAGDGKEPGLGSGRGNGGSDGSSTNGIPPGIVVGAGPTAHSSAIGHGSGDTGPGSKPVLMADATALRVTTTPRAEESSSSASEVEKKVFGVRKFYSMTLNMPNLNSAGGSWVIRFAQLKDDGQKGDLTAPVATHKADPAYPLELMRHNVQGTVTLRAVIHSDGSVGEVSVLRGVDDQLDQFACAALARWRFLPATKNGSAVDLEAVVMIPFRPARGRSGF